MESEQVMTPSERGEMDYLDGKCFNECPYAGASERSMWEAGWRDQWVACVVMASNNGPVEGDE